MTVTTSITGDFTAKIQGEPDFKANQLGIYNDADGFYHFSGIEDRVGASGTNFSTIYIIVKKGVSTGEYTYPDAIHLMQYIDKSNNEVVKANIKKGTFSVNFDTQNTFKMGFDAILEIPGEEREIVISGKFNLTQN
jgi:hypothetical protein